MKIILKTLISLFLNLLLLTTISYSIYSTSVESNNSFSLSNYFTFIADIMQLNFWITNFEIWHINYNILATIEMTLFGLFTSIIIGMFFAAYCSFSQSRISRLFNYLFLLLRLFPMVILITVGFVFISENKWFGSYDSGTNPELINSYIEQGDSFLEILIKLFLTSMIAGYFTLTEYYIVYSKFINRKLDKPNINAIRNTWSDSKVFFVTMFRPILIITLIHLPRMGAILLGLNLIIEYYFGWIGVGNILISSLIFSHNGILAYMFLVIGALIVLFNSFTKMARFVLDPFARVITDNEL